MAGTIDRMNTIIGEPVSNGGWIPGDAATGHLKREIVTWTENLFPQETPLYSAVKKGKPVTQKKYEWGAGAELYHTAYLEGAILSTDLVLAVESGQGNRFQVNDHIVLYDNDINGKPDISTENHAWVRAINDDYLTLHRNNLGGTVDRGFADGAYIVNLGATFKEGEDFTISPFVHGDFLYNYTETIQKGTRISFEANEIPDWEFDSGPHIARLMTENTRHAKRMVEDRLFRGKRQAETDTQPSFMGGFPQFIPSGNKVNLSGYPISPYDIESIGASLWDTVGDAAAKKLIMSMTTARMFDGILNKYRQADMDDTSVNLQFKTFETRFGQFQIMHTRSCPEGVIYGVNINNLSIHPFKGMDWQEMEHTGVNGAYKWRSVFARLGLVVRSPETMFQIHGFSTDLTNYGRTI